MNIQTLVLGPLQSNCYVVWDDEGHALVVDPGCEPDRILRFLDEHGLTVLAYPITHAHADHIGALSNTVFAVIIVSFRQPCVNQDLRDTMMHARGKTSR